MSTTSHGHRHDDVLHVTVISPWPGSPGNRKAAEMEARKMLEPGEWLELMEEDGNDYTFRASDATHRLLVFAGIVPDDLSGKAEALVCECETLAEANALYRQTAAVLQYMAAKGQMVDPRGKYQMFIEERVGNGEWVHVHD